MFHAITAAVVAASLTGLTGFTGSAGFAGAPVGGPESEIPTELPKIDLVSAEGTGCTLKTIKLAVEPDNSAFTVAYQGLSVTAGGVPGSSDVTKTCKIVVKLTAPEGYTYGTTYVSDYAGTAKITDGDAGLHRRTIYFKDQTPRELATQVLAGPISGDWSATDLPADGWEFAPCGAPRPLVLENVVRVVSQYGAKNTLSLEPADGSPGARHELIWKACPGTAG